MFITSGQEHKSSQSLFIILINIIHLRIDSASFEVTSVSYYGSLANRVKIVLEEQLLLFENVI